MRNLQDVHVVMHPLISSIQKIALYETKTKLCIIASNSTQTKFRVLRIDRMEQYQLVFFDDGIEYTQEQVWELVQALDPGGRSRGYASKAVSAFGIVGFVRFLEGYYLILVTKRRRVAVIGLHTIYKIEDTQMIYIPSETVRATHPDEARYLKMFQSIDLSSNFYFSYSYDITSTLQVNMAIPRNLPYPDKAQSRPGGDVEDAENEDLFADSQNCSTAATVSSPSDTNNTVKQRIVDYAVRSFPNRKFVWNLHLIETMEKTLHSDWILYIMHGFVSQSNISVFGRSLYITLIARRSNKYAGTRFLKRGANFEGDVANEVETEQVLEDTGVSSCDSPRITSFVQMRGSIPAHWSQDISKMVPKPAITFDLSDPFAEAAGSHFNDLLGRYGAPIIILNLVKKREKKKHESMLSEEFSSAVRYLNKFLPPEHSIQYVSFDMARMNKGKEANVMGRLADIARSAVNKTGIYQVGVQPGLTMGRKPGLQTGIIRVNCVDCLDRTNTAQFALGKCALGYQLCALGILATPNVDFDTDCVRLLEVLYEDHGDTLALQYGGSQLVHRIKTYRKTAPWTSQGNDIMQTLSRYYSNTFSDAEKQHAMNLFLGLFIPEESQTPIWDMVTDYYLHHSLAAGKFITRRFPLTQWWNPAIIDCLPLAYSYTHKICAYAKANEKREMECIDAYSDFHRPHELSVLNDTYACKISHSVRDFMPHCVTDFSPFTVRVRPGRRREETAKNMKNPSLTGQSSTSSTTSSARKKLYSPWMRLIWNCNHIGVDSYWLQLTASCLHPVKMHFNQNDSPTLSENSSSMESDDEDLESKCSDSHQSSPAKDVCTSGFVTFQSLFPSMKQTYGVDISTPSRPDSLLYKRYVLTDRIISQPVSSAANKQLKLTCSSSFSDDSSFEVTPPKVDNESLNIYKHYVGKSNGVQIDEDMKEKYRRYINCELGIFHCRV